MSILTEVDPTFTVKCTIRGVTPLMVIGRQKSKTESATESYDKNFMNFCPECRFFVGNTTTWWWPFNAQTTILTGGWSVGNMSLNQLYLEHKWFKNRWSRSNCGFDLVKYRGCTLYLPQHAFIDYIFFVDSEYKSLDKFLQEMDLHPLQLITHPSAILVKSRERAGPRRTRKVYVPRPSWWSSGWSSMAAMATEGLFCWFAIAIDLDNPWIGKYQRPNNDTNGGWWTSDRWYTKWKEYLTNKNDQEDATRRTEMFTDADHMAIRAGPFMLRNWKIEHEDYIYPQLTMFYKAYFTWGGRNLSFKTVCDPKKPLTPS